MQHQRTRSRELALQYLYMHDLMKGKDLQLLSDYMGESTPRPDAGTAAYTRKLVETVLEHREELDEQIAVAATNWKIARMAIVDRNILRLGLAELMACPETPYKVAIDEAIELARRFSTEEACGFVNGILDKLRDQSNSEEPSQTETKKTESPVPQANQEKLNDQKSNSNELPPSRQPTPTA